MAKNPRDWKRDFKGIWIPKEIWFMEELSHMERILFAEIDSLDNERGCIASNEYFAEFMGKSERMIQRYLETLKELELIEVVDFDGRRRVIHSLLEYVRAEGTKLSGHPRQKCHPTGDKNVAPYIIDKKGDKKGNTNPPSRNDRHDKTDLTDIEEMEERGWI